MGSGATILAQTGPLEPHREQCSLQGAHLSVLAFSEDCNCGSASSSQDTINLSSYQGRNILRSQRGEPRTKPLCLEMEKKPFHLIDWREKSQQREGNPSMIPAATKRGLPQAKGDTG